MGHHQFAMDADESRPVRRQAAKRAPVRRPRSLARPELDPGRQRDVRDLLYDLHEKAGRPALAELEKRIADDDRLDGSPKKDVIQRIISQGGTGGPGRCPRGRPDSGAGLRSG